MNVNEIKDRFKKIGELLVSANLITQEQLNKALNKKKESKKKLGEVLVELEFASEEDIAKVLALQLGLRFIDLSSVSIDPEAIQLVPEKLCRENNFIPISISKDALFAVFADPLDLHSIDTLRFRAGRAVVPA